MAKYSAQALRLLQVLSSKDFRRIEEGFRKRFSGGIEVVSLDGNEVRKLCSGDCHPAICRLIRASRPGRKRCRQERKHSIDKSLQTGRPHISLCHGGIVLGCVPIINADEAIGGVFFAKWIWGEFDEKVHLETMRRLSGLRIRDDQIWFAGKELDVVSARLADEAAEFLYALLYEITGFSPPILNKKREHFQEDADAIKSRKTGMEKRLVCRLKTGDLDGAKEMVEAAVGEVFSGNDMSVNQLKSQLGEMLSVLVRTAAESRLNTDLLLLRNAEYISDAKSINTREELCKWAREAFLGGAAFVYELRDAEKMKRLKPAVEFMNLFYGKQISLANIARAAGLSVGRLCHLFREQTGLTVIEYLTDVRIENAKKLLLKTNKNCSAICYEIGYKNQSYFTKVFKEVVGVSPGVFREEAAFGGSS